MDMGIEEKLVGLSHNNNNASHVAMGKRTKRRRPLSPCAVTSSCSSANAGGGADHGSFSSPTTPFESTGKEEEDMANCLILLAQGKREGNDGGGDGNNSTKIIENVTATTSAIATTASTKIGSYNYECKTCNKTFPSFQALGGHRASHNKPKMTLEEKKSLIPPIIFEFEEAKQTNIKSTSPQIPISLQLGCGNNRAFHENKAKIHECSICGAEFTSGQALGGHMRRHRTSTNASTNTHVVNVRGSETSFAASAAAAATMEFKSMNVLEIDLNLPAPEEDIRDSNFQYTATSKSMVLPATPALVGCHY